MSVGANSYGTTENVGALVPRYVSGTGDFDESTKPRLEHVENFIDQVSALCNAILAREGFSIPLTNADAVLVMESFVESEVAAIVEGVNGSGRFGPTARKGSGGGSRWGIVWKDVAAFVAGFASGLANMGETKARASLNILTRDVNDAGDEVFPIFQREAFDNVFVNYDV